MTTHDHPSSLPATEQEDGIPTVDAYQALAQRTDRLGPELDLPILGLFGEVGSLLAALKKARRDPGAATSYAATVEEELGDSLWYLAAIASRAKLQLADVARAATRDLADWDKPLADAEAGFAALTEAAAVRVLDPAHSLIRLAGHTGDLVRDLGLGELAANRDRLAAHLIEVLRSLLEVARADGVDLGKAARANLAKNQSRWPSERRYGPLPDDGFPEAEQLPRRIIMTMEERLVDGRVKAVQMLAGEQVGAALTDNKVAADDYRFHDVFHLAFAAHLSWSPVLRSLLKRKRKSAPVIDENEDGARAAIIEEGVSAFIFARALERNLFEGFNSVEYDLLKAVKDFVRGFEVERRPLWQWEAAILDGFGVFRALKRVRSGTVTADLLAHTLIFKPVVEAEHPTL